MESARVRFSFAGFLILILKYALQYYTGDFTRLLVSTHRSTVNGDLIFILRTFDMDTQTPLTVLCEGLMSVHRIPAVHSRTKGQVTGKPMPPPRQCECQIDTDYGGGHCQGSLRPQWLLYFPHSRCTVYRCQNTVVGDLH